MSHLPSIDQVESSQRIQLLKEYEQVLWNHPYDPAIHKANMTNLAILSQLCLDPDMYPVSDTTKQRINDCANLLHRIINSMLSQQQWEASKQLYAMIIPLIEDIINVSDLEDLLESMSF